MKDGRSPLRGSGCQPPASTVPASQSGIPNASETPLADLLRRIPLEAIFRWQENDGLRAHCSTPVGSLSHRAANRIDELQAALRLFARMAVADDRMSGMTPATLRAAVAVARVASGMEAEGQDREDGPDAKHDSPVGDSRDAQPPGDE